MNKTLLTWVPLAVASATAVVGFSTAANAVSLGAATGYNVYVTGDVNLSSDTEGKMAIGGNATLSNYSVGLMDQGGDALIVGKNLTFNNGTVYGNAVVGGTANLTNVDFQGGALKQGSPINFGQAAQSLLNLSQSYLSNAATQAEVTAWNAINLTSKGSQNIFSLSGADLAKATSLNFLGAADDSFVINVSGSNISMQNFGFLLNGVKKQNILFNFFEASNLTASGLGIEGSILAPKANVTFNNGQMNGTLVAANLQGNGQFNHVGRPPAEKPPKSVPEPTAIAGLGLAAAALINSRRKTKQVA